MSDILLCTHNPLLIKGLYGILRDEGCKVDISDHPAQAVQQIMNNAYEAVVIDSHTCGMTAEEAVKIIKAVSPDIKVILLGYPEYEADALSIKVPADLETVRSIIHNIRQLSTISHNF